MELKAQRQEERQARRGDGAAPRLVVIVALSTTASASAVKGRLVAHCGVLDIAGPLTVTSALNPKSRFTLVAVDARQPLQVLSACLGADVLVPVVDATEGVSEAGSRLASAIKAQGLPAVLPIVTDLQELASKSRHAAKKGLLDDLQFLFPNTTRVMTLEQDNEGASEVQQVFRFLESIRLTDFHFLEHRSLILAESVRMETADAPAQQQQEEPVCKLIVTGYLRGGATSLSANQLVHVMDCGDFQVDRILVAGQVVSVASQEKRPPLQPEHSPDPLDEGNEQTWPTQQEIEMADAEGADDDDDDDAPPETKVVKEIRRKRRVPAGMSEYQAAWLGEDDLEDEDGGSNSGEAMEDDDHEDQGKEGGLGVEDDASGAEEMDTIRETLQDRERDDQQWPDEVEVPANMPARERFARLGHGIFIFVCVCVVVLTHQEGGSRYRGLDSFRTSVWDAKEMLPPDYSRIHQIRHFAPFVRKTIRDTIPDTGNCANAGQLVTLEIANFPLRLKPRVMDPTRPVVVGSLLQHESKISVIHFDLMRSNGFVDPVPSKEELIFSFGFRRVVVNPLFSVHVSGCDKCKYERFLPHGGTSMASFYGPITFTPCTVVVFKRSMEGLIQVAAGSLRTVNADLLIIKKIILTAHPSKIHKRAALCRGMFREPADVKWFKPVSLWTKYGRIGHVRESNGTKGDFKAIFDGQLNSADTVCMSLYRRIFPKSWCRIVDMY